MSLALHHRTTRGPTLVSKRSRSPDLARGFMLLCIALVHASVFRYAAGQQLAPTDQFVEFCKGTLLTHRARPLFAFLFGYGMVQLWQHQRGLGNEWLSVRKLLRRRGFWMVVIGFLHTVLLAQIDIIAIYGLTAVIFVGVLQVRERTLLWLAGAFLVPVAALGATFGAGTLLGERGAIGQADPSLARENPLLAIVDRAITWPMFANGVLFAMPAVLLGIWAARRRVLDEPARHRRFLVRAAAIGLGLAVAGGLPAALMLSQVWAEPSGTAALLAAGIQFVTGYGGIGWAALIGLLAIRLGDRQGRFSTAVEALGQRSMTFYLFQSVVFVAVFAAYAGGLGALLGVTAASLVAVATWLVSVLLADLLRRAGHRGPAEVLLRRLTYRNGPAELRV